MAFILCFCLSRKLGFRGEAFLGEGELDLIFIWPFSRFLKWARGGDLERWPWRDVYERPTGFAAGNMFLTLAKSNLSYFYTKSLRFLE